MNPSPAPFDNLIDGRALARQIQDELVRRIATLKERGLVPGLAFVRVGEDPASKVYVGRKEKTCAELGIPSETHVLAQTAAEGELLELLARLNADPRWHGILVQAPLPVHVRPAVIYSAVLPDKDVDGFHPLNVGKLMLGDPSGFLPCTPAGICEPAGALEGRDPRGRGGNPGTRQPRRQALGGDALPETTARQRHGNPLSWRHSRPQRPLPAR